MSESCHQTFTDQDRVDLIVCKEFDIAGVVNSAFSHNQVIGGNLLTQTNRMLQVCFEKSAGHDC